MQNMTSNVKFCKNEAVKSGFRNKIVVLYDYSPQFYKANTVCEQIASPMMDLDTFRKLFGIIDIIMSFTITHDCYSTSINPIKSLMFISRNNARWYYIRVLQ